MKKIVLVLGLLLMGMSAAGAELVPAAPLPEAPAAVEAAAPAAPAAPIVAGEEILPVGLGDPAAPVTLSNCYPAYQACKAGCGGNAACLGNCLDLYNACRRY